MRNLVDVPVEVLHSAFIAAFSDYLIPMKPALADLAETLRRRGYSAELSFADEAEGSIAAFTLNGAGTWMGRPAAYDAGTGVLPPYRGQGRARRAMEASIAACRRRGVETYVLEVIRENGPALQLYEELGFRRTRDLRCLILDELTHSTASSFTVKEIDDAALHLIEAWSDVRPSWQNSSESIRRSSAPRRVLGIEQSGRPVGAIVVYDSGDVPQLAVDATKRGRGVGSALLRAARQHAGKPLRFINVDAAAAEPIRFLERHGARELIVQHEMAYRF